MSLREEWPKLSPRERDARVAEALGREVVKIWSAEAHAERFYVKPDPDATFIPEWGIRHDPLPFYSTSWEHAGPLLDKLREEGWCVELRHYPACAVDSEAVAIIYTVKSDPYLVARGETLPSAIALAFSLSREQP